MVIELMEESSPSSIGAELDETGESGTDNAIVLDLRWSDDPLPHYWQMTVPVYSPWTSTLSRRVYRFHPDRWETEPPTPPAGIHQATRHKHHDPEQVQQASHHAPLTALSRRVFGNLRRRHLRRPEHEIQSQNRIPSPRLRLHEHREREEL